MAVTTEIRLDSFRELASEMSVSGPSADSLAVDAAPTSFLDSLVDTFMKPAEGAVEQTANLNAARNKNADLGIKQASNWKPETKLADNKVATGVVQSNNTAIAMGAEAKEGLANIADIEKNMKEQAAPDAKTGVGNVASLAGIGKGLLADAALVGIAGFVAGPGGAAAVGALTTAVGATKALTTGGGGNDPRMSDAPSPKSVTLKGQEARDARRGYMPEEMRRAQSGPTNSFEAQARQAEAGTGYSRAPVTNAMFKDLAKGPGFGLTPDEQAELGPRSAVAHDSLSDSGFDQIKLAKAGFENQLSVAQGVKKGLDARANNGVAVTNAADLGDLNARDFQMTASAKAVLIPGMVA